MEKKLRNELRKTYFILEKLREKGIHYPSPYCIYDWITIFSKIESNVWHDFRASGIRYLNFYPQFPVNKYFIDFADPIKKVGIEVDGKEWHLDKEKDNERQNFLESLGWKIYRIEGWRTFGDWNSCFDDCDDEDENEVRICREKYKETSEYILKEIDKKYAPKLPEKFIYEEKPMSEIIEKVIKEKKIKEKIIKKYKDASMSEIINYLTK